MKAKFHGFAGAHRLVVPLLLLLGAAACSGIPPRAEPTGADLLRPFPRAAAVVASGTQRFRVELFGEAGDAASRPRLETWRLFLGLLSDSKTSGLDRAAQDDLLTAILELLARQTETNPPKYVSHGSDHSLRAARFSSEVLDAFPLVAESLASRYALSPEQGRFAVMLVALLHDTGYADLAEHRVKKWLHGPASGLIARRLFGRDAIAGHLLATPALRDDLIRAVALHGNDDSACQWIANPEFDSRCRFRIAPGDDPANPTSKTTPLLHAEPFAYVRDYVEADATRDPLLFTIRLADNLDASYDRLTPDQRSADFVRVLFRLFEDAQVRGPATDLAEARGRALETAPAIAASHRALVDASNGESALHFYSNWILDGVELIRAGRSAAVAVHVRRGVEPDLDFEQHVGLGLYQVNRLAVAAAALRLGPGRPLLDELTVTLDRPVAGLDSTAPISLRAFTRRTTWTADGPARTPICSPFCAQTPLLTQSLEPCLPTPANQPPCDLPAFAKKTPFSDLDFGIARRN